MYIVYRYKLYHPYIGYPLSCISKLCSNPPSSNSNPFLPRFCYLLFCYHIALAVRLLVCELDCIISLLLYVYYSLVDRKSFSLSL